MTTQQQPSTAMAIIDTRQTPLAAQLVGEERVQLLAEQIGRGWKVPPTPAELEVIALLCKENRWNIFAKPPQVHFIKRWDNSLGKEVMTPQTSIDGMRLAASRSPRYIGPAGWSWCGQDGVWRDIWLAPEPPRAARAGIYIRGSKEPVYAVALWDEWAQYQDEYAYDKQQNKRVKTGNKVLAPFWAAKPAHMLAKTAEMMVIKQACPAETDSLELAHLEELERLEVPARAEAYLRIYGNNEDAFGFQGNPALPEAKYVPPRERTDLEDVAPPMTEHRQRLIDVYAKLVKEAIELKVIVGQEMDWIARVATRDDNELIEFGRKLRALVNNKKMNAAKGEPPPMVVADPPEDVIDPGDMGEGGWVGDKDIDLEEDQKTEAQADRERLERGDTVHDVRNLEAKPAQKMIQTRSALAQKLAGLIEQAAKAEVQWDDCKPTYPAAEEDVIRMIERLEDRLEAHGTAQQTLV